MKIKLSPLRDFVVAQADEATTQTASGIILTGDSQKLPKTAKILAVGKDTEGLAAGDRIIFVDYSATEVEVDKVKYLLIQTEHIMAKVND